jgi:hypothetical protein
MVGLIGCGCCGADACPPGRTGWDYVSLPQSNATSRFVQETWNSIPTLNGDWNFCTTQTVNGVLRQFGGTGLLFKLTDPQTGAADAIFNRADYSWDMTLPQVPSATTGNAYSEIWTGPVINWEPVSAYYGYSFIIEYTYTLGLNFGTKTYRFAPWDHATQCGAPVATTGDLPAGAVFTVGSASVSEFWTGAAISETVEAFGNWDRDNAVWDVELKVGGVVKIKANGTIPADRINNKACFGEFYLDAAAYVPLSGSPSANLPTHDNTLIRYTYT